MAMADTAVEVAQMAAAFKRAVAVTEAQKLATVDGGVRDTDEGGCWGGDGLARGW